MNHPIGTSRGSDDATADALVMLGITGDLGEQKLFPALVELARAGRLDVPVIGVGRTERSDHDVRQMLRDATEQSDAEVVESIDLHYVAGDAGDVETFDGVADLLDGCGLPVVYAALPPAAFGDVARCMHESRLSAAGRLVVEKPFGSDASDARRLHDTITRYVGDDRLFMVDHFLAKAAVENLLTFRTENPIIDAVMRRGVVDRIEVTMAESFGVDGRGSFYDGVGAIADVMQNHLLQLIAVLTMERPDDASTAAFDGARSALVSSIDQLDPATTVVGQYAGYSDLDDVPDETTTETFVATRMQIDNDRWAGVPILARAGKQLAATYTEAVMVCDGGAVPNRLRFVVKPDTSIHLEVGILAPHHNDASGVHGVEAVRLTACAPTDHGPLGDYATMLDGAMRGDQRHFAQIDDVEAAWRVVDRVVADPPTLRTYPADSMGPSEADALNPAGSWVEFG